MKRNITFTAELADALVEEINAHKNRGAMVTGGKTMEAAIYNKNGSISLDYSRYDKKFYLELGKEINCFVCGEAIMCFSSLDVRELITVIKCFDD